MATLGYVLAFSISCCTSIGLSEWNNNLHPCMLMDVCFSRNTTVKSTKLFKINRIIIYTKTTTTLCCSRSKFTPNLSYLFQFTKQFVLFPILIVLHPIENRQHDLRRLASKFAFYLPACVHNQTRPRKTPTEIK